jgi:hypothetical protein
LGDRIELRDWKGFRGGLDVNRTRPRSQNRSHINTV